MRTSSQTVRNTAADRPALARWPSQPPLTAAVHPHPGGSWADPSLYTITPGAAERPPGNHFSQFRRRFLHALVWASGSFPDSTAVVSAATRETASKD
jgi:hypothetical protein